MRAENGGNRGCPSRDSAEHEGDAGARKSFNRIWKERDSAQPELLERILDRNNLNRTFRRVKAGKGVPGVDGMTSDEAFEYFRENREEFIAQYIKTHSFPSEKSGIPKTKRRNVQTGYTCSGRPDDPTVI